MVVMLPVIGGGCKTEDPTVTVVDLPAVTNNTVVIPLVDFPELTEIGGSLVGRADGYPNPIVVAHVDDVRFAALDAICTHMRCTVAYNALNITLDCPCHNTTYEVDGTVIGGPAPRPLTVFAASSDGTNLTITLG